MNLYDVIIENLKGKEIFNISHERVIEQIPRQSKDDEPKIKDTGTRILIIHYKEKL